MSSSHLQEVVVNRGRSLDSEVSASDPCEIIVVSWSGRVICNTVEYLIRNHASFIHDRPYKGVRNTIASDQYSHLGRKLV